MADKVIGKVAQIAWRAGDDEAALKRRYQTEREGALRPRLLWLVRQGQPIKRAAQAVGVHDRTARQWVAWYRQGGVEQVRQPRRGTRR